MCHNNQLLTFYISADICSGPEKHITSSVIRLGDLLEFGQVFKDLGNN